MARNRPGIEKFAIKIPIAAAGVYTQNSNNPDSNGFFLETENTISVRIEDAAADNKIVLEGRLSIDSEWNTISNPIIGSGIFKFDVSNYSYLRFNVTNYSTSGTRVNLYVVAYNTYGISPEKQIVDKLNSYITTNIAESGTNTYVGKQTFDGRWLIMYIAESSGNTSIQYATIENNSSYNTYSTAYAARESLTYQNIDNLTYL